MVTGRFFYLQKSVKKKFTKIHGLYAPRSILFFEVSNLLDTNILDNIIFKINLVICLKLFITRALVP